MTDAQSKLTAGQIGRTLVATGEIGNSIYWKREFQFIGQVRDILAGLENLKPHLSIKKQEQAIDWDALIGTHHYFDGIRIHNFPPLYNIPDFQVVFDDFLVIVREPKYQIPCYTFLEFRLYLELGAQRRVCKEFTSFLEHLKALKVLHDAGLV